MDKYDIDRIFKDGLQNPPSNQYNEQNWKDLEKRLRKDKKPKGIILLGMISSAVAAAVLLFFIFNTDNEAKKTVNDNFVKSESIILKADSSCDEESIITSQVQDEYITESNGANILAYMKPIMLERLAENKDTFENNTINDFVKIDSEEEKEIQIVANEEKIDDKVISIDTPQNIAIHKVENNIKEKASLSKSKMKGAFSVLAALDLTEVRGAGQQKLSENVGILYTYPFTNRLSMSTGVLYSKKNYNSPFSYYKPEHSYAESHVPKDVSAVCDVLSVPIWFNYQISSGKKYAISISSGLSSLFMLKEKYEFSYEGNEYKSYTSEYTIRGKNQHYFGVADFSVSVDRKINEKLSIGIRPFVQIPLTGIGYGRTNLQSKGIALTFGINSQNK